MLLHEMETHRRIKISLWAYAYEFHNHSIVSDAVFDFECRLVCLAINTMRPDLDAWFRQNFQPHTGMWVRAHPELEKLHEIYVREYAAKK